MEANAVRAAQAGTLESMDCLVVISEGGAGRNIEISGAAAARFRAAIDRKINETLDVLGASEPLTIRVQDNGALDAVLGARVEAAYERYRRLTA